MSTLSRLQILEQLKDPDIKDEFSEATLRSSERGRKLTLEELKEILRTALTGHGRDALGKMMRTVNSKEEHDLRKILRYRDLTDDAKSRLRRFLRQREEKKAKRYIKEVIDTPREKRWVCGLILESNGYSSKGFQLPDNGVVYDYRKFKVVAELIANDYITVAEMYYGGSGETESISHKLRGSYRSTENWLYFRRGIRNWMSTIIHEATHVIQDFLNLHVTVGHIETAAHIIQAVRIIKVQGKNQLHSKLKEEPIYKVAAKVATGEKTKISDKEYTAIKKVLQNEGYDVNELRDRGADDGSAAEQILWKTFF